MTNPPTPPSADALAPERTIGNVFPPNFGEMARGIKSVVLPDGSREAIERLSRDVMAFGYGMGAAAPHSNEQLDWHDKAENARDAIRRHVGVLQSERDESRADRERLERRVGELTRERELTDVQREAMLREFLAFTQRYPDAESWTTQPEFVSLMLDLVYAASIRTRATPEPSNG